MNNQSKGWTNDVKKDRFPLLKSKLFWFLAFILLDILIVLIAAFWYWLK